MTCPCPYVCRPWASSPSLQARNGSTTKKLGAGATGMAQALSTGDDVILACGEKVTVMAEFGIVMVCYVTATKMQLNKYHNRCLVVH